MSDLKKDIRFKNLPLLLKDMKIKKWVIDSLICSLLGRQVK